jgi:hypothetical protein
MSSRPEETERLRRAFAARPGAGTDVTDGCPEPDRIWLAVHGDLPRSELGALLDHLAACAGCAEAWTIARGGGERTTVRDRARVERGRAFAAAAAAVVLSLGLGWLTWYGTWPEPQSDAPVLRDAADESIRSLVPETTPLARDAFVLRWSEVPGGARYRVVATNDRLDTLAQGRALGTPQFQVPAEALEGVPAGQLVFWRVEAELPDGRHVSGPTFVVPVE